MITPEEIIRDLTFRIQNRVEEIIRPAAERIIKEECARFAVELSREINFETTADRIVVTLRIAK